MDTMDVSSEPEERRVLYAALDSFRLYRQAAHYNVTHLRRQSFYSLPSAQIDVLSAPPFSLPDKFRAIDDAIDTNADLSEAILQMALQTFGISDKNEEWHGEATTDDMDKACSTIKQCYRDWSLEGESERKASYSPIFAALHKYLSGLPRNRFSVLIPGAGLGRLVFEINRDGYNVEGNELSFHQLLASKYVLNHIERAGQHKVYPWCLNFSNHVKREHQLQSISIPDTCPALGIETRDNVDNASPGDLPSMSMSAGDFCSIYRNAEHAATFDSVVTCFFIDTAPNLIHYIDAAKNCLKPGGVWINHGPLLWHFESDLTPAEREQQKGTGSLLHGETGGGAMRQTQQSEKHDGIGEPGSFELSHDEVIDLVAFHGFEIVENVEAAPYPAGYISDPRSMLQMTYRPVFWVARRK